MIGFFLVGLFVQEAVNEWEASPVITYFGDEALPVTSVQVNAFLKLRWGTYNYF